MNIEFYQEGTQDPGQREVWGILSLTRSMRVEKGLPKAQRDEVKDIISKRIKDDLRSWLFTEDGVDDVASEKEQWELLFEILQRTKWDDEHVRLDDSVKRAKILDGLLNVTMKKLRELR